MPPLVLLHDCGSGLSTDALGNRGEKILLCGRKFFFREIDACHFFHKFLELFEMWLAGLAGLLSLNSLVGLGLAFLRLLLLV